MLGAYRLPTSIDIPGAEKKVPERKIWPGTIQIRKAAKSIQRHYPVYVVLAYLWLKDLQPHDTPVENTTESILAPLALFPLLWSLEQIAKRFF